VVWLWFTTFLSGSYDVTTAIVSKTLPEPVRNAKELIFTSLAEELRRWRRK
jgi:hypothetical protein